MSDIQLWDMIEGHSLFSGEDPTFDNIYTYNMHFLEMQELMGPAPQELLDRGKYTAKLYDKDGRSLFVWTIS